MKLALCNEVLGDMAFAEQCAYDIVTLTACGHTKFSLRYFKPAH